MAWQITFPHSISNAGRSIICRMESADAARRKAESMLGFPICDWPIIAREIPDEAAEALGIADNSCVEIGAE
jgi:hypothetical protein